MERPSTYDWSKVRPVAACPYCGTHGNGNRCRHDDRRGVARCACARRAVP